MYTVGRCKIRDWRKKFDMTQQELSELSGVDQTKISKYENNDEKPGLKNAKNIADIFNCHIDDLYEWSYIVPVSKGR